MTTSIVDLVVTQNAQTNVGGVSTIVLVNTASDMIQVAHLAKEILWALIQTKMDGLAAQETISLHLLDGKKNFVLKNI